MDTIRYFKPRNVGGFVARIKANYQHDGKTASYKVSGTTLSNHLKLLNCK